MLLRCLKIENRGYFEYKVYRDYGSHIFKIYSARRISGALPPEDVDVSSQYLDEIIF